MGESDWRSELFTELHSELQKLGLGLVRVRLGWTLVITDGSIDQHWVHPVPWEDLPPLFPRPIFDAYGLQIHITDAALQKARETADGS